MTKDLEVDGISKLSPATLISGTYGSLCIFDPINGIAPTSGQIIYDTSLLLETLSQILQVKGMITVDLNNRKEIRKR